jgi:hypothetical protein
VVVDLPEEVVGLAILRLYHHLKVIMAVPGLLLPLLTVAAVVAEHRL